MQYRFAVNFWTFSISIILTFSSKDEVKGEFLGQNYSGSGSGLFFDGWIRIWFFLDPTPAPGCKQDVGRKRVIARNETIVTVTRGGG